VWGVAIYPAGEELRSCQAVDRLNVEQDTNEVLEVSSNVLAAALFEPTARVLLKFAGQLVVSCWLKFWAVYLNATLVLVGQNSAR
jgi:hypothetical protein